MRKITIFVGITALLISTFSTSVGAITEPTPGAACKQDGVKARSKDKRQFVCASLQGSQIWVPLGGDLIVALSQDPGTLNPAATTSGAVHTAAELMFNGLVELDDKLNPIPGLAESWTINKDATRYAFKLRRGVTWHDGRPFTSDDVKYTFEEVLLKYHSRTRASMLSVLESIKTPSRLEVVFNFKVPYAPLLLQLDVTEAPIVPAHIYRGTDPTKNPANLAPIGTGPFKFVSYSAASELVLAKNQNYFRSGRPFLNRLIMRVIPSATTQVLALEAGSVDYLWGIPGPDRDRLLKRTKVFETLTTRRNPGGANCMMTVGFNLNRPITSNLNVRKAISYALDRGAFLRNVVFGQGSVPAAPFSQGIPWAWGRNIDMPKYNITTANLLLDAGGWTGRDGGIRTANGVPGVTAGTKLSINFLHFPTFASYAELYKAQLREVGIDVQLRPLESGPFSTAVFTTRNFDTNIISYCNGTDPEIGIRRMYDSAQIGPVAFSNAAAYSNRVVDGLFEQARGKLKTEQRQGIYQKIQEQLVKDVPYVWLLETTGTRIYSSKCGGFRPYGLFAEDAFCSK